MKKLKNVLLVLAMTVMCLVFYYVFVIFVDISNLVKKEPATNIKEEETLSNTIDGDIIPTEPTEEEDKEISIVVFGENFVHDSVKDSGKQSDGTYNYDFLFDNLKMYASEADIAAIYQTTIIGGNDLGVKGYPNFNTPEEMISAIEKAGINVALLASNHTNDLGTAAIKNSISLWKSNSNVLPIGVNNTIEDAENIPVMEVKGVKVALLNYTAGMNKSIESQDDKYMVNYLVKDEVVEDITKANEVADYVIVFPYWVADYTYETTDSQRELAKAMVEAGADLIVGASSHYIGEIEKIQTDNGNVGMCYYSVGNFCSSFNYADAMIGGIARITLKLEDDSITLDETKTGLMPVITHYTHTEGNANITGIYPIWTYTSEMASSHGIITRGGVSFSMEFIEKIISDYIDEKYLLRQ